MTVAFRVFQVAWLGQWSRTTPTASPDDLYVEGGYVDADYVTGIVEITLAASATATVEAAASLQVAREMAASAAAASTAAVDLTTAGGGAQQLVVAVAAGSHDAEENTTTGAVSTTSSDLEMLWGDGVLQIVGLWLDGITVPPGATITNTTLQFTTAGPSGSAGSPTLVFRAEASDDAPAIAATANDLSGRTPTTASVNWNPPAWAEAANTAGPNQRTDDLSPIIQELVDRPGWVSGNAILILVTSSNSDVFNLRTAWSKDGASGVHPPILTIDYTP